MRRPQRAVTRLKGQTRQPPWMADGSGHIVQYQTADRARHVHEAGPMPSRRGRTSPQALLSPRLEWVISAVAVKDRAEETTQAEALRALGLFAMTEVPM